MNSSSHSSRAREHDPVSRTNSKRDRSLRRLLWLAARLIVIEYFWLFHRVRFTGRGNVPRSGAVVFAPNHVSYYDPPLIMSGAPRRVCPMAWEGLFRVPILKQMIIFFGAYPVKLKSADKSAVAHTLGMMRGGKAVLVFPEGERGGSGALQQFENGIARISLQTGAAIVPVAITGAFESWPRTQIFPRWFCPIEVKYYPPIVIEPGTSREEIRQRIQEINEAISRPLVRRLRAYARLKERRKRSTAFSLLRSLEQETPTCSE